MTKVLMCGDVVPGCKLNKLIPSTKSYVKPRNTGEQLTKRDSIPPEVLSNVKSANAESRSLCIVFARRSLGATCREICK